MQRRRVFRCNLAMKTFLTLALITGLAFTGGCGKTNQANSAVQNQQESLSSRTYTIAAEFEGNLKHLAGTKEGESNQEMLLRFFKESHIEIKPPEAVFLKEEKNLLFVHATSADQDKIERVVIAIQDNVQPSKIH